MVLAVGRGGRRLPRSAARHSLHELVDIEDLARASTSWGHWLAPSDVSTLAHAAHEGEGVPQPGQPRGALVGLMHGAVRCDGSAPARSTRTSRASSSVPRTRCPASSMFSFLLDKWRFDELYGATILRWNKALAVFSGRNRPVVRRHVAHQGDLEGRRDRQLYLHPHPGRRGARLRHGLLVPDRTARRVVVVPLPARGGRGRGHEQLGHASARAAGSATSTATTSMVTEASMFRHSRSTSMIDLADDISDADVGRLVRAGSRRARAQPDARRSFGARVA